MELQGTMLLAMQAAAPPIAGRSDSATQTQPSTGAPAGGAPQGAPQGMGFMWIALLGIMLGMIVITSMSGRKERKRRAEMLSTLRRHDRVQTVGGIIGSVAEVRDDEVVLKVDEATNTKLRIARSSIQSVLKKAGGDSQQVEPAEQETQTVG